MSPYLSMNIIESNIETVQTNLLVEYPVQWGSENRTCPVFEWSKVDRFPNGPVFELHLKTGHLSGFRMVLA